MNESIENKSSSQLLEEARYVQMQMRMITDAHSLFGVPTEQAEVSDNFNKGLRALNLLRAANIDEDLSVAFASFEIALATLGEGVDAAIEKVGPELRQVISLMFSSPLLRTEENIDAVILRTKNMMNKNQGQLFVEALLESVKEREVTAGASRLQSLDQKYYADPTGVIVTDPAEFREGDGQTEKEKKGDNA